MISNAVLADALFSVANENVAAELMFYSTFTCSSVILLSPLFQSAW